MSPEWQKRIALLAAGILGGQKAKDVVIAQAAEIASDKLQDATQVSILSTENREHIEAAMDYMQSAGRKTKETFVLGCIESAVDELKAVLE